MSRAPWVIFAVAVLVCLAAHVLGQTSTVTAPTTTASETTVTASGTTVTASETTVTASETTVTASETTPTTATASETTPTTPTTLGTTTTATTTAQPLLNCTVKGENGRFSIDPTATCSKTYGLCFQQTDGSFSQWNYTCPGRTFFNPATQKCTRSVSGCS